jgi:hypothetical protein
MGIGRCFDGHGATLISSLMVAYLSPRLIVGIIYPIVAMPSWLAASSIGFWAAFLGKRALRLERAKRRWSSFLIFLWMSLSHKKSFMRAINPIRHLTSIGKKVQLNGDLQGIFLLASLGLRLLLPYDPLKP